MAIHIQTSVYTLWTEERYQRKRKVDR